MEAADVLSTGLGRAEYLSWFVSSYSYILRNLFIYFLKATEIIVNWHKLK